MSSLQKTSLAVTLLLAVLAAQGCAHVPAYDRQMLAHPTMVAGDLAGPGESHLRAIQEGATGGSVGAESGCGCN